MRKKKNNLFFRDSRKNISKLDYISNPCMEAFTFFSHANGMSIVFDSFFFNKTIFVIGKIREKGRLF